MGRRVLEGNGGCRISDPFAKRRHAVLEAQYRARMAQPNAVDLCNNPGGQLDSLGSRAHRNLKHRTADHDLNLETSPGSQPTWQ
jgi:hypothetical protein